MTDTAIAVRLSAPRPPNVPRFQVCTRNPATRRTGRRAIYARTPDAAVSVVAAAAPALTVEAVYPLHIGPRGREYPDTVENLLDHSIERWTITAAGIAVLDATGGA